MYASPCRLRQTAPTLGGRIGEFWRWITCTEPRRAKSRGDGRSRIHKQQCMRHPRTRVRRQEVVNRILAGFPAGRKRFYNSRRKFPAGRKWAFEARHLGDKTSRLPLPDTGVIRAASRRAHRGGTSAVGNPLATGGDLLFFQATYTRLAQLPVWRLAVMVIASCGEMKE